MTTERDYVLGTHDEEIIRLGLQHRVWRPRTAGAWRRAGFTTGQTLIDVGCGPGYAALDLAEIVGPSGRVIAVDQSRRFLEALEGARNHRGLDQLRSHELNLDQGDLPATGADGAWARWVFSFVRHPRQLLDRVARALRPGASLVMIEYFDYRTWRVFPREPDFEAFVAAVVESWRANGGEPDIALDLLHWLDDAGFELRSTRPYVDVIRHGDYMWEWPRAFVDVGLRRLVDLGSVSPERARAMTAAFARAEANPNARIMIPGVLEIIATRK